MGGHAELGAGERTNTFTLNDLGAKMRSDDPADHYDVFLALPRWRRNWGPMATGYGVYARVSSLTSAIDRYVLRMNAERILIKSQAPWGKQVDDKYKNYV